MIILLTRSLSAKACSSPESVDFHSPTLLFVLESHFLLASKYSAAGSPSAFFFSRTPSSSDRGDRAVFSTPADGLGIDPALFFSLPFGPTNKRPRCLELCISFQVFRFFVFVDLHVTQHDVGILAHIRSR